ncbi:hypothetical protein Arub01_25400 [Actinomadura rubrobrunea]|uniref:Uncharacterized protein n=1 Tax=Actinomadura rubrobrunea TaxID=115335 RepID=A0A9W6PWJ1_9ACTN|nr:hypothetical protein [Actinomadura rubrobrunea]GLW64296.1 hypothetical protein Arub01_25400 [Actinomadura rubrobrunea]
MRPLAHLADRDDAVAFDAFDILTSPALRDVARGPLHRARHAGRPCYAPMGQRWCDDCEATFDDLRLSAFQRLRSALKGPIPTTRSGEPVRELVLLRTHVTSPQAQYEDTAALAPALRRRPSKREHPWLRAARAQLVHYPVRYLEERTRRADAVQRGAAAHPDRDLRQAAWAAPLRSDPVMLDMLIYAVFAVRRGTTTLFEVPDDLRQRHDLSRAEATWRLRDALIALRKTNPAFYHANIDDLTLGPTVDQAIDPQTLLEQAGDREVSRSRLRKILADPTTGAAYRAIIKSICEADRAHPTVPVQTAARSLHLTPEKAHDLINQLAREVAKAGLDWTIQLAETS